MLEGEEGDGEPFGLMDGPVVVGELGLAGLAGLLEDGEFVLELLLGVDELAEGELLLVFRVVLELVVEELCASNCCSWVQRSHNVSL